MSGYLFQLRRGTAAQWATKNPVLRDGEPGLERDTGRLKVGDGATTWTDLPYVDTTGLSEKADAADVAASLQTKANASTVGALSTRVDTTETRVGTVEDEVGGRLSNASLNSTFLTPAQADAAYAKTSNLLGSWVGNLSDTALQSWQWGTTDRLSIAFYGDSISQGAWAGTTELTDWPVKGLVGKFRQAMQRIYGNGGIGFIGLFRKEWTKAGTWAQVADYGPFAQAWSATANTATYTLTTKPGDGDNVDVFYVDTSSPFSYSVNGGAAVTVTPPGGASNKVIKVNVALPSDGTHTLQIIGPSSGILYLVGAAIYKGTGGCVVHNVAKSGALIGDLGYNSGVSVTRMYAITDHLKPRLNVIGFVANDYTSQTPLATYNARLGYLIDRVLPLGDTVLWAPPDNGVSTAGKTITLKQYEDEMKAVAVARGIPWVDVHAAWGAYSANGPKMYDTQHPNEAGHNDIAARFLRVLRRAA